MSDIIWLAEYGDDYEGMQVIGAGATPDEAKTICESYRKYFDRQDKTLNWMPPTPHDIGQERFESFIAFTSLTWDNKPDTRGYKYEVYPMKLGYDEWLERHRAAAQGK